jgi:protein PhnA
MTQDTNGSELLDGDTIQVIKDLKIKGTSGVVKRGTIVKRIRLTNNPDEIEGKVDKTVMVLKTCFIKKSN